MALPKPDEGQGAGQWAGRIKDKYRYIFKDNPVVKTCKVSKDKHRRSVDPAAPPLLPRMPPDHV